MAVRSGARTGNSALAAKEPSYRFEPVRLDSLFSALDAVAWMEAPTIAQVAQFAGVDPRTAGKLIKNACLVGLVSKSGSGYVMATPYPYKGSQQEKEAVVREGLVRLPLLQSVKQFARLGDDLDTALRKAATVASYIPYDPAALRPLVTWAQTIGALDASLLPEDLVDAAALRKEQRHVSDKRSVVAFLSHSSSDKAFVRQLASDLSAAGIDVWLDEQRIRVGDSIPEKISQGLALSDFFIIIVSRRSVESEWVKKELSNALVSEVQRRQVHVMPVKIDEANIPSVLADKKYADFSVSYKRGLDELIVAMRPCDGI